MAGDGGGITSLTASSLRSAANNMSKSKESVLLVSSSEVVVAAAAVIPVNSSAMAAFLKLVVVGVDLLVDLDGDFAAVGDNMEATAADVGDFLAAAAILAVSVAAAVTSTAEGVDAVFFLLLEIGGTCGTALVVTLPRLLLLLSAAAAAAAAPSGLDRLRVFTFARSLRGVGT